MLALDPFVLSYAFLGCILALATYLPFRAGDLHLGIVGFYGLGGAVAGWMQTKGLGNGSFSITMELATSWILSLGISWLLCRVSAKLQGVFFTLSTLAFAEIVRLALLNLDVFGGAIGIFGISPLSSDDLLLVLITLSTLFIAFVLVWRLCSGLGGKRWTTQRLDPFVSLSFGLDPAQIRWQTSAWSSVLASSAGVLAAHSLGTWSSRQVSFDQTMAAVCAVILGGATHPWGVFVVGLILGVLPEWFRELGDFRLVFCSLITLIGALYFPRGVSHCWQPKLSLSKLLRGSKPASKPGAINQTHVLKDAVISSEFILNVKNLNLSFGGLRALQDVSVTLRSGQILGIIGANGAGKTTLLNSISGFVQTNSGSLSLLGKDISALKDFQRFRLPMGRTFQNIRLLAGQSVLENVTWSSTNPRWKITSTHALERATTILDIMGLVDVQSKSIEALSYGQKRAVELARAVYLAPQLLLLDEPAAGLNLDEKWMLVERIQTLFQWLQSEVREAGVIIIDHHLPMLQKLCHELLFMEMGKTVIQGSVESVSQLDGVIHLYGKK